MTNQNQPGQQNQAPGQKPGQQGGGSKPGQQSQAPGKDNRNPKEQPDTQVTETARFADRFFVPFRGQLALGISNHAQ